MKPHPFAYVRATSIDDVFASFERFGEDAALIAGGQSLVPALNMRLAAPRALIDIAGIAGLNGIEMGGGTLRIGALATHREVEHSPLVAQHAPILVAAAREIAHPAIRACGTFGGAMAHADPSAEFPACAIVLDATFEIAGRSGTRLVRADAFFRGYYETAIEPGEVLVAVRIPLPEAKARSVFLEVARRQGDYAIVGIALHGTVESGMLATARIAFFGVAGLAVLVPRAAAELARAPLGDPATLRHARDLLGLELDPPSDHVASADYRVHLARVLLARAVARLHAAPDTE